MDTQKTPIILPPGQMPVSEELPEGVNPVNWAALPYEEVPVDYHFDTVYDERDGKELKLQILLAALPAVPGQPTQTPVPVPNQPLIVYIPGSAWMEQVLLKSLPRLIKVCQRGFAVAVVEYRPSTLAPFPAQIEDAKTAVRFMRKHAQKYSVDPENIAIWGDSSGGHTAVMAGITGDGVFDNGRYGEISASVKCIVDWFAPTDISVMSYYPSVQNHVAPDSPEGLVIGGLNVLENLEIARKTVPMEYLSREKDIPPILIMHGDTDDLVNFNQSCRLYDKLIEIGKDVTMYKLEGSGHGTGGFHSIEAVDTVCNFVRDAFDNKKTAADLPHGNEN
ncbi:MAG: alpha/beta hydrolase [Clostridiales bacterium]|nr:alpha/beta hydrolase [Clostridiales bacterium]